MRSKILWIDDEKADIKQFSKYLYKYRIIPSTEEEFKKQNDIIAYETKGECDDVFQYVEEQLKIHFNELRLLIIDLELHRGTGTFAGAELIRRIRHELKFQQNPILPKSIPILCLTNFAALDPADAALNYGATFAIKKAHILDKEIHFASIVESMINYYVAAYVNGPYTEWPLIFTLLEKLEGQGNLVLSKLGDLDISINGVQENQEQTLAMFDFLFKFQFESFDTSTRKRIFDEFHSELQTFLSEDQISKLDESIWDKIKETIQETRKNGGFQQFVDLTFEILKQEKLLSDKGILIGVAIKGMLNLTSSRLPKR